jgi:tryptophanyl-tRNA synthetase
MKPRLVSAITASGSLHIGNYLGAVKQFVQMQDDYETYVFVADLHAITVPQDPVALRAKTFEIIRIYLAAGLDPNKVTLFAQSHVPQHTELAWVLNTVARMGDMEKMSQPNDEPQCPCNQEFPGTAKPLPSNQKPRRLFVLRLKPGLELQHLESLLHPIQPVS